MQDAYQSLILPDVQLMLQEGDAAGLAAFCTVVHPAAVAEIFANNEAYSVVMIAPALSSS